MTEQLRAVDPSDEHRHPPEADPLWNESFYLDFVSADDTLAGYVRLGFYPNLSVAWWTTAVVEVGRQSIVSAAYDLPADASSTLRSTGSGVDVELTVDDPLRSFGVRATASGRATPGDGRSYDEAASRPVELDLDLTWTTDGVPFHYEVTTRYEIPALVTGSVTIGGRRVEIDGQGQRDHSWGVRDWWAFGWCWLACRLDDGTRLHAADIRIPGMPMAFGYMQAPKAGVVRIEELVVTEVLEAEGFPDSGVARIEPGGLELAIEPLGFGPLLLVADDGRISRFPRAVARFTLADGRTGTGWIEWNQPQPT